MKNFIIKYIIFSATIVVVLVTTGCKKQDEFLSAKPNQSLIVPATLADYQSLLNNTNIFNTGNDPSLGLISSDEFYVLPTVLTARTSLERNAYLWAKEIYDAGADGNDWNSSYMQVYYANIVLDGLGKLKINSNQQSQYNQIKGAALFFRSYAFYSLVQTFALPYDPVTSKNDLGIPLRLSSDLNIKSVRPTVQACYDQLLSDLKIALPLLPVKSTVPTNPSQAAVNGLLARIYLAIGSYPNALTYSNSCLAQNSTLVDYNTLSSPTSTSISNSFLGEEIFHASLLNYSIFASLRNPIIDSVLYASYSTNDLRKTKFFGLLTGYMRFIGSYDYRGYKFSGLATDEILLIRAECYARSGDATTAMKDLNTLLVNRWKTGTFVPYRATSSDDALDQILAERKKELVFRGLRWTDLRRLNKESRFKVTLQRNINSIIYTLPPNDPRYAMPIPDAEIKISGLQQNIR